MNCFSFLLPSTTWVTVHFQADDYWMKWEQYEYVPRHQIAEERFGRDLFEYIWHNIHLDCQPDPGNESVNADVTDHNDDSIIPEEDNNEEEEEEEEDLTEDEKLKRERERERKRKREKAAN